MTFRITTLFDIEYVFWLTMLEERKARDSFSILQSEISGNNIN